MHVSMHVENESGGVYKLRERQTERSSKIQEAPAPSVDGRHEKFYTPENYKFALTDSGFSSSLEIDSDPDWFLRPKRPIDPRTSFSPPCAPSAHNNSTAVTPPKMQRIFRPTYVDYSVSKFPKLNMERIIGGLILIISITSVCFGLLISSRFFESSQMELNGKYRSLQYGNRNAVSSDNIEPRIDVSSTLKEFKDSPPLHIPRAVNFPKSPSKKLRRSKNLNPLMVKPKPSMSRIKKLITKSFENDYEDPNFRGGRPDPASDIDNDYDVPSFRGGNPDPAMDTIENDYPDLPSFRGGRPSPAIDGINNDYDSDPSFRGKNIYEEGVVDLMGSV